MNKKLFTKKRNRKKSIKNKNLYGGDEIGVVKDKLKNEIQQSVKEIYNFFEVDNIKKLETPKKNIPFTIDENLNINLTELSNQILVKVKSANKNYNQYDFEKYNLICLDCHGNHDDDSNLVKCPDNVYICIMSYYNHLSQLIDDKKKNIVGIITFMKELVKEDFKKVCYFKSSIGDFNKDTQFIKAAGFDNSFYGYLNECFFKSQWIYPNQFFHNIGLSNDRKYKSDDMKTTYISNIENEKLKKNKYFNNYFLDQNTLNDLYQYVDHVSKKYKDKINIILLDTCRCDDSKKERDFLIVESYYLNNTYNKCLQKILIDKDTNRPSKNIKKFFCSNNLYDEFKNEFLTLEYRKDISIQPLKNDNLHPIIPKLKNSYDNLISLNEPYKDNLRSYFSTNKYELVFLINLSPNKFKKFLFKIASINPVLCKKLVKYIKNKKEYKIISKRYSKYLDDFFEDVEYEHINKRLMVFKNYSLQKMITDIFDISYIFNKKIPKTQIKSYKKIFPNSSIFNDEHEIYKKNLNQICYSDKIKLNGFESNTNPFYNFTILHNQKYLKNVKEIEALNCKVNFKLSFRELPDNMQLQKVNIDNSLFYFHSRFYESEKDLDLQTHLINKFDSKYQFNELQIRDLNLSEKKNESITINNFKIFDLHFGEYNECILKEIILNAKIDLLSIENGYVENIKLNDKDVKLFKFRGIFYKILNDIKLKKNENEIISGYKNVKNMYIEDIFFNNINNIYLFEKEQFLNLTELKLIKLTNLNINKDVILCKKLKNLEISDCEIYNFKLNFENVSLLQIKKSNIKNEKNYNIELKKSNKIQISLTANIFENFNIFLNLHKLKNSKLNIKNNQNNETRSTNPKYFNLLSKKLYKNTRHIIGKNEIIRIEKNNTSTA